MVLIVYVLIVGILVPLKPGIIDVTPDTVATGERVELQVTGYNTHYAPGGEGLRAWLKVDEEHTMAPEQIVVKNESELVLTFQLPTYLPSTDTVVEMTLLLDNPEDGWSNYPAALFVKQNSVQPDQGEAQWVNAPISKLHTFGSMTFPYRNILVESIRNTYFHVSLWFAMLFMFVAGLVYSIRFLRHNRVSDDEKARSYTMVGIFFGLLGLITGMIWAKYTWGAFWNGDPKQNMTAIALLIYLAYFVLRGAFPDAERGARVAGAYNIFAFVALIPLIYVVPRMLDSLHPGAGGNITFGSQDMDNTMRMVFYPAIIGWTLIGVWLATLRYRLDRIQEVLEERLYTKGQ